MGFAVFLALISVPALLISIKYGSVFMGIVFGFMAIISVGTLIGLSSNKEEDKKPTQNLVEKQMDLNRERSRRIKALPFSFEAGYDEAIEKHKKWVYDNFDADGRVRR